MKNELSPFLIVIAYIAAFSSFSCADDRMYGMPSTEKFRDDVVLLDLRIPFEVVIKNERPHIYLGIKNIMEKPFAYMGGLELVDAEEQLYFQARSGPDGENLTRPHFLPNWERLEQKFNEWGKAHLLENEFIRFNYSRGHMNPNYDIVPPGTREIRIGMLVGPNQWAFSEWKRIRELDNVDLHHQNVIELVKYPADSQRTPIPLRKVNIEENDYIFVRQVRAIKNFDDSKMRIESSWSHNTSTMYISIKYNQDENDLFVIEMGAFYISKWNHVLSPQAEEFQKMEKDLGGKKLNAGSWKRGKENASE